MKLDDLNKSLMNNTLRWCGYEWLKEERWGQIHPEKPYMWYDPTCVLQTNKNGKLFLFTKNHENQFGDITSPIGVGLVSCIERFSYGTFSLEAQLPVGPNLWPAFWMYAWEEWPPEIDVFEAYSYGNGSYINRNMDLLLGKWWRIKTNIHLGKVPNNYNAGAENGRISLLKDPTKNYIEYRVDWFPDVIRIWYDNKVVRCITDPSILSQFKNKTMNVVINNGIQASYNPTKEYNSVLSVKNFQYTPYE